MTQDTNLKSVLPKLQAAFTKLRAMEDDPHIDWVTLLELRERADALTDDSYYRGYVMGVLDALGVSTEEAVQVLRTSTTRPKSRRRIVQINRPRP